MNPLQIIELLRVGSQLLNTLTALKADLKETNPELWAEVADDFNNAVSAFTKE